MQTPQRKLGKYAHLKLDPNLTEEKYNELQNKLARLKKNHPAVAAEVKRLAEMGDFSENAAYQIAKGRLRGINQKILDIEDHLKRAVIISRPKNTGIVELGHKVTVETDRQKKTYLILGSSETDPQEGVISHNSPLGSALIGCRVGDIIKMNLKNREVEYKLVLIE
jgi:transcription elongation factor GreA